MKPVFGRVEEPKQSFIRINKKVNYRADFLWHFHHVYELNLILKGNGNPFVGDHIGHYEDGDLVLMAPELPHTWYGDPRLPGAQRLHQSIGIQFAASFLGESPFREPDWKHIGRLFEAAARGVQFTGRTRQAAARKVNDLERLTGPARLIGFLSTLDLLGHSEEYELLSSREFTPRHPPSEKRIDKVCRHISQHYTRPLTLPEAAEVASLSVSAFSHFFKATTGKTFTAYVNELRVGLACKLLVETEKSVAEVAFESGFNNLSNFNRRFLGLKGVTPKLYRKQYLAAAAAESATHTIDPAHQEQESRRLSHRGHRDHRG